ncbi:MAG: hypothetical protein LQ352_007905, partial [Teloschistes flavicans]
MASASSAHLTLTPGLNTVADSTSNSNAVIDLTADTSDSDLPSVMDMDMDLTEEETEKPQATGMKALSPVDPLVFDFTNADTSDSELSPAMDMDTTEDEMEMPKAKAPIKQGFACFTRGNHVSPRRPRLYVPPKDPVRNTDETETEKEGEEETVLPSVEEATGSSLSPPKRGNPVHQPSGVTKSSVTETDSTEDEEETSEIETPTKQYFSTPYRRNAISAPSPQSPNALPPPTEKGISMSIRAAALVADPNRQIEDGPSLLLRAAALMERSTIRCTSSKCPITHPHGEGLYRHPFPVPNSELANLYFAPSIPPPHVVAAFNTAFKKTTATPASCLDVKAAFFDHHTSPCRPSKHLVKVGKLHCKSQHCGLA